jgi:membrane protease YdiL (CAAX protease family)
MISNFLKFDFKNLLKFEKKIVFSINFFLILLVMISFYYDFDLKYFFYFNIFFTFFLSYIFFRTSKKLSKTLIVTNMFILFYFLFPKVAQFLYVLLGSESYLFIVFYNVLIAYLFLFFSGYHKNFLGDYKNFSLKFFFLILLLSLVLGLLFFFVKEPLPGFFDSVSKESSVIGTLLFLLGSSFAVGFSEQIIFSGFLYNIYKNLTNKVEAILQVSLIFVFFHMLRVKSLVNTFYLNFGEFYYIYLFLYYLFLFFFMYLSVNLYSFKIKFKGKEYRGNIFYPIILHTLTDFSLFFFYYIYGFRF